MSDWSVRNQNASAQYVADALLRATGGYSAIFLVPPAQGDTTDAGQLGIDSPNFQQLAISPVIFRRTRATVTENKQPKYELLVSASAIAQQLSVLQLSSPDALLGMIAGVTVSGLKLLVETWASSLLLGQPVIYRLLLRSADQQSLTQQS